MSALKSVLSANMDALACQLDCMDSITRALEDIKKSLSYERELNTYIEGELKVLRIKKRALISKSPVSMKG